MAVTLTIHAVDDETGEAQWFSLRVPRETRAQRDRWRRMVDVLRAAQGRKVSLRVTPK